MNLQDILDGLSVTGHLIIRDVTDKLNPLTILNKKNAIHNGNMVYCMVKQMVGTDSSNTHAIGWFAFGDGGSFVQQTGQITYRPTNTINTRNELADLYSRVFQKKFGDEGANMQISPVIHPKAIADININIILQAGEPFGQLPMDNAVEFSDRFVFDEIGLFSNADDIQESYMLTHVVFHPIQKSLNRVIEIDYTLRFEIL